MSTDPTTTSQVQAYRFMLRRMQSALVRKDAVMLHEPMRHHLRATAIGLILGVFGLAAFYVVGRFSPTSEFSANDIIIGTPSGAVYVAQGDPLKLIPVPNVTSARLLVATIAPGQAAPAAQQVTDSALGDLGRLPGVGLPGAPPLPAPENLITGVWSVCDAGGPQSVSTVVVQERAPAARTLTDDQALLVAEPNTGLNYLVWHNGRARIDPRDLAIRNYYRLGNVAPRKVSAALLNAIPEGRPLTLPVLPSARPFPALPGTQVGDIVVAKGVQDAYYLLLPEGTQLVEPAVAELIRQRSKSPEPTSVTPEAIARVPEAPVENQLNLDGFAARVPQVLKNTDTSTACLTWQDPNQPPVLTLNPEGLPLASGDSPIAIPPAAASNQTADFVFLPPTKGVLVRGVVPGQRSDSGAIWLVTDQGFRYGLPSMDVARSLGLGDTTTPAPEPILALLPIGDPLDPELLNPSP